MHKQKCYKVKGNSLPINNKKFYSRSMPKLTRPQRNHNTASLHLLSKEALRDFRAGPNWTSWGCEVQTLANWFSKIVKFLVGIRDSEKLVHDHYCQNVLREGKVGKMCKWNASPPPALCHVPQSQDGFLEKGSSFNHLFMSHTERYYAFFFTSQHTRKFFESYSSLILQLRTC